MRPFMTLPTLLVLVSCVAAASAQPTETKISPIADGVYFWKAQTEPVFTGSNQAWIAFKDFVVVIDSAFPGPQPKVIEEIKKTTGKPIRYVINSHFHGDHADGNGHYSKLGAHIIAAASAKDSYEKLAMGEYKRRQEKDPAYKDLDYAMPTLWVDRKMVIDDGTQRAEIYFFGTAHTEGDLFVYLPKQKILFTGDACVNGPFNFSGHGNLHAWIDVLTQLEKLDVKTLAPGHGELGDAAVIKLQKRYFVELLAAVDSAMKEGKSLDEIRKFIDLPFYKEWTGVAVRERVENIAKAYQELKAKNESKKN